MGTTFPCTPEMGGDRLAAPNLLLAVATTGLKHPLFVSGENIANILYLSVPLGLAALCQAAVMLMGRIDLVDWPCRRF
jgi:ribose/xylose/arabinose/galactoside ABC-type transport system permease subunit